MQLETQTQNTPQNPFPEPAPIELIPLNIIRTETVLSKLPVHNLAKKGRVDIQITKLGPRGEVELRWEVSYSERYGQARQLAYKLDTIVIDQAIDEAGKPLPERLRLGSLRDVCECLNLSEGGRDLKSIKRAFLQNASAFITAKLKYKGNDGTEHTFEAGFTRYSVIFTGQKFSDGSKADAVYIELHPRYREVLNNATMRPLNLDYKKTLPPAAQRFYEIVSYKIFAALKYNNQPFAKLPYSEYCTFSAQQRYFDYDHFKKQMYKIHRPHLLSGYITKVHYDHGADEEGRPDWIMCYVPGPKARAEYATFTGKKLRTVDGAAEKPVLNSAPPTAEQPSAPEQTPGQGSQGSDDPFLQEMTKRGITEKPARKLLQNLTDNQVLMDQLEWGDYLISQQPRQFKNPSGFYVYLIRENVIPPPSFEPSRLRHAREQQQLAESQRQNEQLRIEVEYRDYKDQEIERYIQQNVPEAEITHLMGEKRKQLAIQFKNFDLWSPENLRSLMWGAVKAEISKRVPFLTLEVYRQRQSEQLQLFSPAEGQGTAVPAAPPPVDENLLRRRYQDYGRKQAEAAIDSLDMMERGRRTRAARMYLLHEHPEKERFAHMIAEGQFDEFQNHSQQWLIEQTIPTLSLPDFETWKGQQVPASPR